MKRFLFLLLSCATTLANAQAIPDSIILSYNTAGPGQDKIDALTTYIMRGSDAGVSMERGAELLKHFKKNHDEAGADYTEAIVAAIISTNGEYAKALDKLFPIANRMENRKDTAGLLNTYLLISGVYRESKNYLDAIAIFKKCLAWAKSEKSNYSLSRFLYMTSLYYSYANMPDSGIAYAQQAVAETERNGETWEQGYALGALAKNYIAKGEYDIALPFLRKSYQVLSTKWLYEIRFLNNDFAELFLGKKMHDSTYYYATEALKGAIRDHHLQEQARAYELLYKSFDHIGMSDSSNKYFRLAATIKDTIYSAEKLKAIETVSFKEQLRQQELAENELLKQQERTQNIQYALIAIGILVLLSLYLLLSRSFITNTRLIAFFGVVGLLIVFEFLNLLVHPFLEKVTHHNPLLMLLALVSIAALLVPLHHRTEKWAVAKLVEKNKKIRLAQAKKTIEELENN